MARVVGGVWSHCRGSTYACTGAPLQFAGIPLGGYAVLFEPSIREVVVVAPPASHAEGPARSMSPPAPGPTFAACEPRNLCSLAA
jgi:hypothetical protein